MTLTEKVSQVNEQLEKLVCIQKSRLRIQQKRHKMKFLKAQLADKKDRLIALQTEFTDAEQKILNLEEQISDQKDENTLETSKFQNFQHEMLHIVQPSLQKDCELLSLRQKTLLSDLKYIFPVDTSKSIFSSLKISQNEEILDDSHDSLFLGECLTNFSLAIAKILDVSMRYPMQLLPEAGACIQNLNDIQVKLCFSGKKERLQFGDCLAMIHCNLLALFFKMSGHLCKIKKFSKIYLLDSMISNGKRNSLTKKHAKNILTLLEELSISKNCSSLPESLNSSPRVSKSLPFKPQTSPLKNQTVKSKPSPKPSEISQRQEVIYHNNSTRVDRRTALGLN